MKKLSDLVIERFGDFQRVVRMAGEKMTSFSFANSQNHRITRSPK